MKRRTCSRHADQPATVSSLATSSSRISSLPITSQAAISTSSSFPRDKGDNRGGGHPAGGLGHLSVAVVGGDVLHHVVTKWDGTTCIATISTISTIPSDSTISTIAPVASIPAVQASIAAFSSVSTIASSTTLATSKTPL